LILQFRAGQDLDLEIADAGLSISWEAFEGLTRLVTSRQKFNNLGGEALDLIFNIVASTKSNSNILLVVVLILEIVSLVLACSKLILELLGRICSQLISEISTLG